MATSNRRRDPLDEWVNWRGLIVRMRHHTYCRRSKNGGCTKKGCRPVERAIDYVVVGGIAANYIRDAFRRYYPKGTNMKDYLVLVPITQDTDEDSFELVKREDCRVVYQEPQNVS